MDWVEILRFVHVLGATVLIGTGAGIAFFMLMAHRSGDPATIAPVAAIVVRADFLFTASAVIIQPVSGLALASAVGWPLTQGWLLVSMVLYVAIGLCWLPVIFIQIRLRDMAQAAQSAGDPLPEAYKRLFRAWAALGVPAFAFILAILWLMLVRPDLGLGPGLGTG